VAGTRDGRTEDTAEVRGITLKVLSVLQTMLFVLAQVEAPLSPASVVPAIHADLAAMPVELRARTRYLSLYKKPFQQRLSFIAVLNGHVNHLSREPDLGRVSVVGSTAAALVRVVLDDYGWSAKTWDKFTDPYFSVTVDVPWGTYDKAGNFRQTRVVRSRAIAPWIATGHEQQVAEIVAWTQSKVFVCAADWWLDQTSAGEDRSPNYYDMLGITTEKDFDDAVGFDAKLAQRFAAVARDAVSVSAITRHDRAIVALGKIRGTKFKTLDHGKDKAGSALRVLGADADKGFDASEQIAALPNKLFAYGLFDNKGARQDKAPENIVRQRVDVYRSCIECHQDRGLQDVTSWVQPLLRGGLNLQSPDYLKARELRREYLDGLGELITEERVKYDRRIKEATGLDYKAWSAALTKALQDYETVPVTLDVAAADLGVSQAKWRSALEGRAKAGIGDTVLSPLLVGGSVTRSVWENEYASAQLILGGYQQ